MAESGTLDTSIDPELRPAGVPPPLLAVDVDEPERGQWRDVAGGEVRAGGACQDRPQCPHQPGHRPAGLVQAHDVVGHPAVMAFETVDQRIGEGRIARAQPYRLQDAVVHGSPLSCQQVDTVAVDH